MSVNILYYDIETEPMVVHAWGLRDQNIGLNQIVRDPQMMGFAFKAGDNPVRWTSKWDRPYSDMLRTARLLFDEADVVVTYNGVTFDNKWLNGEFVRFNITPPSPFKNIDLYKIVRQNFRLPSYRLAYVAPHFGIGHKVDTGGHELWFDCMHGDEKARRKMARYCKQDVALLPDLLEKVRPYLPASINMALLNGIEGLACQKCGGTDLESRGVAYTATMAYPQYRCRDCGGWTRDKRAVGGTRGVGVAR